MKFKRSAQSLYSWLEGTEWTSVGLCDFSDPDTHFLLPVIFIKGFK